MYSCLQLLFTGEDTEGWGQRGTKETGASCPVGRGREGFTEEDISVLLLKDAPVRAFWKQGPRLGIGVGQEIRQESRLGTDREGLHVLC